MLNRNFSTLNRRIKNNYEEHPLRGGVPNIAENGNLPIFLAESVNIVHIFWQISEIRTLADMEISYFDRHLTDILK